MELRRKYVCCFPTHWVQFVPTGRSAAPRLIPPQVEGGNQPYTADEWAPMEGTWTRTQHVGDARNILGRSLKSKACEIRVCGTASASSFSYLQENHDRWVGVCYSKVVYSARRLQGNTAILEIVGVSAAVRKVLSDVFLGLVPLQRSGSRMFYGSGLNGIIIVDTDMGIWKEYTFEYAEDVPSVADLLEGALDHIHESNCKDMEDVASYSVYQRTQARPMIVPTFV